MLLALRTVDYVHVFDEADPIAFLAELNPDVHVNGSEYGENCIESDIVKRGGGRVHIVARIPGLSTTNLLQKLPVPDSVGPTKPMSRRAAPGSGTVGVI
jgi:bifunctional ADP-heptose synthase (sugar kinase/adenylyltransferase)